MKKKVTVYIPCFNAARYIEKCLEAVLRQTYPVEEVLIIDDGSKDDTLSRVSRFPVRIISHDVNRGLAAARNTAIRNTKTPFIASLDADCVPHKDWLALLMSNFDDSISGVGGRLVESNTDDPIIKWRFNHMRQNWGDSKQNDVPFLFGSNNVFRKSDLINIGGYNEEYKNNYEDVDLSNRLHSKGFKLAYEPEALAFHIREDDIHSLFNNFWRWQFYYHYEEGYYKDKSSLCLKCKENVGLANRFMEEDIIKDDVQLLYINLLLPLYLSLKDLLFFYNKEEETYLIKDNLPFYIVYLLLLDLSFFYHLDFKQKQLRSFTLEEYSLLKNFFTCCLLFSSILGGRLRDGDLLKTAIKYYLTTFLRSRNDFDVLSEKILFMASAPHGWDGFTTKEHPHLERGFLKYFVDNFKRSIDGLSSSYPVFFDLVNSSYRILKKKGEK